MALGHMIFIPDLSRMDRSRGELEMAIFFRQNLLAEGIDQGVLLFENPAFGFAVEKHSLHIAQLADVGPVIGSKLPRLKVKVHRKCSHRHWFPLNFVIRELLIPTKEFNDDQSVDMGSLNQSLHLHGFIRGMGLIRSSGTEDECRDAKLIDIETSIRESGKPSDCRPFSSHS